MKFSCVATVVPLTPSQLSPQTVQVFMENYPTAVKQGWKIVPIAEMVDGDDGNYRNAADDDDPVTSIDVAATAPIAFPSLSLVLQASAPSSASVSATPSLTSSNATTQATTTSAGATSSTPASPSNGKPAPAVESQTSTQTNGSSQIAHISPVGMMLVALPIAVAAQLSMYL